MGDKMKNDIKYIVLDFGKVLAGPYTGEWFITPNFFKIIDKHINKEDVKNAISKYNYMVGEKCITEEEEFQVFLKFYRNILKDLNIEDIEQKSEKLAEDFVYNDNKYILYSDVEECLNKLSKEYKLLLLSDNWPCVFRIMKNWKIDHYFEKIYVSSIYDCQKSDKIFFDYPILDYNIKHGEAIFVDDNINLVEISEEKGFIPILMDREDECDFCKYEKINSLKELIK